MSSILASITFFASITANVWLWAFLLSRLNWDHQWYSIPLLLTAVITSIATSLLAAIAVESWPLRK